MQLVEIGGGQLQSVGGVAEQIGLDESGGNCGGLVPIAPGGGEERGRVLEEVTDAVADFFTRTRHGVRSLSGNVVLVRPHLIVLALTGRAVILIATPTPVNRFTGIAHGKTLVRGTRDMRHLLARARLGAAGEPGRATAGREVTDGHRGDPSTHLAGREYDRLLLPGRDLDCSARRWRDDSSHSGHWLGSRARLVSGWKARGL